MNAKEAQPPEGRLIEEARKRAGLSQNKAAKAAGMSGTRWRQIVRGAGVASGVHVDVTGPGRTVARMAHAVGVTPDQLSEVGRDDAATELHQLTEGAGPLPAPSKPRRRRSAEVEVPEGLDPEDPDVRRIQRLRLSREKKFRYLLQLLEAIEESEEEEGPEEQRNAG